MSQTKTKETYFLKKISKSLEIEIIRERIQALKEEYIEECSDLENELEDLFCSKTGVNKFTKQEKFELKLLKEKVELYEKILEDLERLLK